MRPGRIPSRHCDTSDPAAAPVITITVTHEPKRGGKLLRRVQRGAMQRMVQRMVDSELDKLPEHLAQLTPDGVQPPAVELHPEGEPPPSTVR